MTGAHTAILVTDRAIYTVTNLVIGAVQQGLGDNLIIPAYFLSLRSD